MAVCKQKISNTENCDREEYKDGLCIIHHDSNDKPDGLFRRIIRDDLYRGFYNFSYMISYEGFNFEYLIPVDIICAISSDIGISLFPDKLSLLIFAISDDSL